MKRWSILILAVLLGLVLAACEEPAAKPLFQTYHESMLDPNIQKKTFRMENESKALYIGMLIVDCVVFPLLQIAAGVCLLLAAKYLSKRVENRKLITGSYALGAVFLLLTIIMSAENLFLIIRILWPT